jgi:PAS domain S-box-containing protein
VGWEAVWISEVPDAAEPAPPPSCVNGAEPAEAVDDERFRDLVRLDALFAAAPIGLAFLDRDYRYVRVNPTTAARLRLTPEEVHGQRLADLDPELWSKLRPIYERVVESGCPVDVEGALIEDGEMVMCRLLRYYPVRVGGELIGFGLIDLDITDRKRAELTAAELSEQRRDLADSLLVARERERRRIAADIHGDTLQAFAALRLRLEELGNRLRDPDDRALLDELDHDFLSATQRLRGMLFELWPPDLERTGLTETIAELLDRVQRESGLRTHLDAELGREPAVEVRGVVFRIVAEAVANARRHARAGRIEVVLRELDGAVTARVSDDGAGFDPDGAGMGHVGLREMIERARAIGGTVTIVSSRGEGTTVQLRLPAPGR